MKTENEMLSRNKRIALRGILIALAMILSYIESFIPFSSAVPGIKIGLANIVTIYALNRLGVKDTIIISLLRIFLSSLLFGNMAMMVYSISGALFSILIMTLAARIPQLGIMGISVAGAVSHNIAQCAAASVLLRNASVMHYLPVLLISGVAAGAVTGVVSAAVLKKISYSYDS